MVDESSCFIVPPFHARDIDALKRLTEKVHFGRGNLPHARRPCGAKAKLRKITGNQVDPVSSS